MATFYSTSPELAILFFVLMGGLLGYRLIYFCAYHFAKYWLHKRISSAYVMELQEPALRRFSTKVAVTLLLCALAVAGIWFINNVRQQGLADPDKEVTIPIYMVATVVMGVLCAAISNGRFAYRQFCRTLRHKQAQTK